MSEIYTIRPSITPIRHPPSRGDVAFNILVSDNSCAAIFKMIEWLMDQPGCSGVEYYKFENKWLSPCFWNREFAEEAHQKFKIAFQATER